MELKNSTKLYKLINDELYIKSRKSDWRKVLHKNNAKETIIRVHGEFHHGINNTWNNVKKNFHGYKLYELVKQVVKECPVCQKHNNGMVKRNELKPIISRRPFEIMSLDAVGAINPISNSNNRYILTAIDHFTKWPIAKAVENIQTSTVVNFIITEIVQTFGVPEILITDRGSNFLSDVSIHLYQFLQIRHNPTTTYRPQANGQVERLNRTLKNSLAKICQENSKDWDCFLWKALMAIRSMKNRSTGISPAKMLYGIEMKLPTTWELTEKIEDFEEETKRRIEPINIDLPEIRKQGLNKNIQSKNMAEKRYNKQ
ncbi:Pol polyprotein, partial [Smittium culicis]